MRRLIFSFLALILLAGLGNGTGRALASKPAGAAAADAAYLDLVEAIREGIDEEQRLDEAAYTLAEQIIAAAPSFVEAESSYPGFATAMAVALRPVVKSHSERVHKAYLPRTIAAAKEVLTEPEARKLAAIVRSPIGRFVVAGPHADEDMKADLEAAAIQALAQLSPEERAELERFLMAKKFEALSAKLAAHRAEMEREPPSAEEKAEVNRAIQQVMAAHKARLAN